MRRADPWPGRYRESTGSSGTGSGQPGGDRGRARRAVVLTTGVDVALRAGKGIVFTKEFRCCLHLASGSSFSLLLVCPCCPRRSQCPQIPLIPLEMGWTLSCMNKQLLRARADVVTRNPFLALTTGQTQTYFFCPGRASPGLAKPTLQEATSIPGDVATPGWDQGTRGAGLQSPSKPWGDTLPKPPEKGSGGSLPTGWIPTSLSGGDRPSPTAILTLHT